MAEDFEKRLQALRQRFLENFPQDKAGQSAQLAAFQSLSAQEKEAKLTETLQLLYEKKSLLETQLSAKTTSADKKSELADHLELLSRKIAHLEDKRDFIHSGEQDALKKDRLKRQLTALEIKRCKALLSGNPDCAKIDEKIAHKKNQYKKSLIK